MVAYSKPHLPYDQQLNLLISRGMTYSDRGTALRALKRIGYYRLSAYTYTLRGPLPESESNASATRSDRYVDGASFDDVLKLYEFDRKLRLCLLDGLETLEVGLAVNIGYTVGKHDPFAHLIRGHLDQVACRTEAPSGGSDAYEAWLKRFEKLQNAAKTEDFVKHFILNYDGRLPIWAATEVMDFGTLVRLFSLLQQTDRNEIAKLLGVKDGRLLHGWLKSLNVLRNHCAHHSRVWNRSMVYTPAKVPRNMVGDEANHLAGVTDAHRGKLYFLAALLAYFTIKIDPSSNWPRTFSTLAKKFEPVNGMTPENTMGFPTDWRELPIWNYDPKAAKA